MRFKDYFILMETHSYQDFVARSQQLGITPEELIRQTLGTEHEAEGGNNVFRRFPNMPYGIRTSRGGWGDSQLDDNPALTPQEDSFPDQNFGQGVARYGNSEILKLQDGKPAGFPYKYDRSSVDGVKKARDEYLNRIREAAEMPLEAYVKIMKQLIYINDKGYSMDPSKSGNLLIDPKSQSFNLVDLNKTSIHPSSRNTASQIATMLINGNRTSRLVGEDPRAKEWFRQIMEKTIQASKITGLPMDDDASGVQHAYAMSGIKPDRAGDDWKPYQFDEPDYDSYWNKPKLPQINKVPQSQNVNLDVF